MAFYTDNKLLFHNYDLMNTMESHIENIPDMIGKINKDQFLSASEKQLHDHIYSQNEMEPITLNEDRSLMDQDEIEVDVRGDPMRAGNIFGHSGPMLVPGIRVTVSIPFSGEKNLWAQDYR